MGAGRDGRTELGGRYIRAPETVNLILVVLMELQLRAVSVNGVTHCELLLCNNYDKDFGLSLLQDSGVFFQNTNNICFIYS